MDSVKQKDRTGSLPSWQLALPTYTFLQPLITPLAKPHIAGIVAMIIYLIRGLIAPRSLAATNEAYFNYLADAFLHGQLALRLMPPSGVDLVESIGRTYLYWPPFPAIVIAPLVFLFGVAASDIVYTAVFGAISIALLARLFIALDETGIAPLTAERRAFLVTALAFGSVIFILAPSGGVWFSAQIIGWCCVLIATVAALTIRTRWTYFIVGVALACATTTRIGLLFNGVWLAYYLLRRDWSESLRWRATAIIAALVPAFVGLALLGWYNQARFGSLTDMGLAWHTMNPLFRDDFMRYGAFNLHYLPKNLYYHFIAYPIFSREEWMMGGGLFWMTPILIGAPYAAWRERRNPLIWSLLLSCLLVYIPVGLVMGTGFVTFGPRYLLDLMVPIVVLTAIGIRHWRLDTLRVLMLISCATYTIGSVIWWFKQYYLP